MPCLFTEGERYGVAFSGGVDSSLLLTLATLQAGVEVTALLGVGINFPQFEQRRAREFCRSRGIPLVEIPFDPLAIPQFRDNVRDRCYFCKKALFTILSREAAGRGLRLVDGTNKSDLNDYRPGMRAAAELGVESPLLQAGLDKEQIRFWARRLGLELWDKPSMACLATRVPTGRKITSEILQIIDGAEEEIRALGFGQVRVRILSETEIRLELDRLPYQERGMFGSILKKYFPKVKAVNTALYQNGNRNRN